MGAVSRLAGRVCVVNGAASTVGRAIAERFAREGGTVVGADKAAHSGFITISAAALPLGGGITAAFTVPE